MTLVKHLIHCLPDGVWLDFTDQSTADYRHHIGRVPKKLIKGPVLNYEVLEVIGGPIEARGITIQKVLVKRRGKK